MPHVVIKYIQDETSEKLRFFKKTLTNPCIAKCQYFQKKITKFVECNFPFALHLYDYDMIWFLCVIRFLDFIWYIGHLVSLYQVRKTLPCCIKDLWGQKTGRGTLTSNIFLTLCNNIILLFIAINNFDTTLSTFCPWGHSGRNMCEVLIFSKHTLWALKCDI